MSLQHILLGCLSKPASGYDLQKEIETALSHFWSVQLPQIYPTLRRMEEDGLVKSKLKESSAGPQRRVYKRTGAGAAMLREWLSDGPVVSGERRAFLAQVYFLNDMRDTDRALAFLEELHFIMEARRDGLAALEEEWAADEGENYPDNLPDEDFFRHLTFDLGREMTQVYTEWCKRSMKRLKDRNC